MFLFFGHLCAMWPCRWHLKQWPSFPSCVHSSRVRCLKGVALAASMSIGTMLEFNKLVLGCGWVGRVWEFPKSHGTWVLLIVVATLRVKKSGIVFLLCSGNFSLCCCFHLSMVHGIVSLSRALLWIILFRPFQNLSMVPSAARAHPAFKH